MCCKTQTQITFVRIIIGLGVNTEIKTEWIFEDQYIARRGHGSEELHTETHPPQTYTHTCTHTPP
jgi:hypothetical protein